MNQYVISARKYRPQKFEEVIGQEKVTQTLQNEIANNKLAQAFLFCGPRGVGKTTCARILANEINQQNTNSSVQDNTFNIFELDAASNNSVEDIRNLVQQVRIPPQNSKYKVYIIDEVHMLSKDAFNAFLKTLEEPPTYAVFILATTEKHKILPTILSRCQIFNFERIKTLDMIAHLESICTTEKIKYEKEALHIIAQKADGALRDALSIFDQMVSFSETQEIAYHEVLINLNVLDYSYYFKLTSSFLNQEIAEVLLTYNEILDKGFDSLIFLTGLGGHIRNLLIAQEAKTQILLDVPEKIQHQYIQQSQKFEKSLLLNALNLIGKAESEYRFSQNTRLLVEITLSKVNYLPSLIKSIEKKKITPKDSEKASFTTKITQNGSQKIKPVSKLSIKTSLNTPRVEESNDKETTENSPNHKDLRIDLPTIQGVFQKLAEQLKNEGKKSIGLLFSKGLIRLENKQASLVVNSQAQAQLIDPYRVMAQQQLKKLNPQIQFAVIIEEQAIKQNRAYTDEEKLREMIEENKDVLEMKNRLGLTLK